MADIRIPRTLTGEARAEWRRIVPELSALGVLEPLDRGLLIRYCSTWASWVELTEQVRLTGRVIRGRNGDTVRNPLWFQLRDCAAMLSEMGRQLMLSPQARLRGGVERERDLLFDPLDELRKRREERLA